MPPVECASLAKVVQEACEEACEEECREGSPVKMVELPSELCERRDVAARRSESSSSMDSSQLQLQLGVEEKEWSRMSCETAETAASVESDTSLEQPLHVRRLAIGSTLAFTASPSLAADHPFTPPQSFFQSRLVSAASSASPVRNLIRRQSTQARAFLAQRRIRRRQRVAQRRLLAASRASSLIIIPANHPVKVIWDLLTVVLTFLSYYVTHLSIRDMNYNLTAFARFSHLWFLLDIVLNFVTEHQSSDGKTLIRTRKAVWARYLTTWFAVDTLGLIPWEWVYVKPIIDMQNRRNFLSKSFFRTKNLIKLSRLLRGRHFQLFGRVASNTKRVGVGGQRLLRFIIMYLPKYLLFFRNMRGVLAIRMLRQIHFCRKVLKYLRTGVIRTLTPSPCQKMNDGVHNDDEETDEDIDCDGDSDSDLDGEYEDANADTCQFSTPISSFETRKMRVASLSRLRTSLIQRRWQRQGWD